MKIHLGLLITHLTVSGLFTYLGFFGDFRRFVQKLPDKGAKIRQQIDKLTTALKRKQDNREPSLVERGTSLQLGDFAELSQQSNGVLSCSV